MGTRQRKKGRKDEQSTDGGDTLLTEQAVRKRIQQRATKTKPKKPFNKKSKLRIWGSIVAVVILFGWLFVYAANLRGNVFSWRMDAATREFLTSFVCGSNGGYCHPNVVPFRRTQKAQQAIRPNQRVLVVPRKLQIWDLDALRDDFVQSELAQARHVYTNNPLHSGAFLAAYLARRAYLNKTNDPMRPYFNVLPTFSMLESHHPALWSEKRLSSLLPPHSWTFNVAKGYSDTLRSEYGAFVNVSFTFVSQVTEEQYKAMRVNVMTRSFFAGPPTDNEALPNVPLDEELEQYKAMFGVDLKKGCHAMVPILDMYNHHPNPNVGWEYNSNEKAFVITSIKPIPAGQEIIDSYGKYTDAHLFSKFGFVNGDGSGYTEASIAGFHKLLDVGMKEQFSYLPFSGERVKGLVKHQKELLASYLIFDDGYKECIEKEKHPIAFELKQLKLEHLSRIANNPKRWVLRMQPRNDKSLPSKSSHAPITYDPPAFNVKNLSLDASNIIETCRLISLSEDDFDGNAIQVLKETLEKDEPLVIDNQGESLEYRALACLARLSGVASWRFKPGIEEEMKLVKDLTHDSFQSRLWTAAQLRLGEIQTLEVLHRVAVSGVMEMTNRIQLEANDTSYDVLPHIHEQPCPEAFTWALLEEDPVDALLEEDPVDALLEED